MVWHELTRLSHAVTHAPVASYAHLVGNGVVMMIAAYALLAVLSTLGWLRWFVYVYWELVTVTPIVGSLAFDLSGQPPTATGRRRSATRSPASSRSPTVVR